MAVNKNGIVVIGAVFVDIKGFPEIFIFRTEEMQEELNISMEVSAVMLWKISPISNCGLHFWESWMIQHLEVRSFTNYRIIK